jgi:hypothetical protein
MIIKESPPSSLSQLSSQHCYFSDSELALISSAISKSPKDPLTGRPHICYSFFSSSHSVLAANFLCSAINVQISPSSLFVIATDVPVFEIMSPIWPNVLLLNARNYSRFGEFCLLKQAVQAFLVRAGCDVTVFDGDIVFCRNPLKKFASALIGCDFVFQQDQSELDDPSLVINIGVASIAPSTATIQILKVWRRILEETGALGLGTAVDQYRLQDILRSGTWVYDRLKRHFTVRLANWVGVDREIVVGFHSPLDVSNAGQIQRIVPRMVLGILVWKPFVIHLAFLAGLQSKTEFMTAAEYNWVTQDLRCVENPRPINWSRFAEDPFIRP